MKKRAVKFFGISLLLAVLVAFIIHVLFSITAHTPWFEAKWGAGEILTYISTYFLGMLAIWQNLRFKEENDKMQERLEKLTAQANELSIISKVIEYESARHERLLAVFDDFSRACNPQALTVSYASSDNSYESILVAMGKAETHIDDSFFAIVRTLRSEPEIKDNLDHPLFKATDAYYCAAKDIVAAIRKNPREIPENYDTLPKARLQFLKQREKYLEQQEIKLNRLIFDELTLAEIKNLYGISASFTTVPPQAHND